MGQQNQQARTQEKEKRKGSQTTKTLIHNQKKRLKNFSKTST